MKSSEQVKPAGDGAAAASDWQLLEALPDMCFVVAGDGTVRYANAVVQAKLGIGKDRIVGHAFASLLSPECGENVRSTLQRCGTGGTSGTMECEFAVSDRPARVQLHLAPYPAQGMPGACVVCAYDVSKDKERELDLLRFANVAHFTVNPLEITDTKGNIVYVNPAFEKASGYARGELLGKNPSIFGSHKQPRSFWEHMWKTITAGRVWVGEVENKRRNGEPFFTQLLVSPIVDSSGTVVGYFGIHRDITHQRDLEQQLVRAQKMESIGMLAAGLAHEVGNPLTSISSIVQVIQRTTADEFVKDRLGLIKSQINRISKIIRELVDFARQTSYEIVSTDLNRVINDAVDIVRVGKKTRDIQFNIVPDEHLPLLPLVPDKIQQVLINILINAVDAMQDSAFDRKQEGITIESRSTPASAEIVIRDRGIGIATDAIPKIFDPFFTTKSVGEGTGLGLWVSYTIVKSFDGDIRVESAEGKGTTFVISFPKP